MSSWIHSLVVLIVLNSIEFTSVQSQTIRPGILLCLPRPVVDCDCSFSAQSNCTDPPLNRSQDFCYLSCCCELTLSADPQNSTFSVTSPPPPANTFTSDPISVLSFQSDNSPSPSRASWLVPSQQGAICSFKWEGDDAQVPFNGAPRQSKSLIPASWTPPATLLPEDSQVTGFQLSVYALADALKPACMIDSFRLGANDVDATDFLWQQFVVTDSVARVRRYVYRNATTRLAPKYQLKAASLATAPYFSIVMTHNPQNGSCWIDCIELQLLYTFAKLTLAPGESTAAAENATSFTTKPTSVTLLTQSLVLDDQEYTIRTDLFLALSLGIVLLLILWCVTIAIAVYLWRRLNRLSRQGEDSAPVPAQAQVAAAGAPAIYQSHGLGSSRYEMLELAAPPGQTNYIPGTALTNEDT
jgi:hypothetical protein